MTHQHVWGNEATKFFFELTPNVILDAVEHALPVRCTGRTIALNSMENRVYDVELEEAYKDQNDRMHNSVIIKFYRPGRWAKEQIDDEHKFLRELSDQDIPVIAPFISEDDETLFVDEKSKLFFTVFPKQQGRSPDELNKEQLQQIGRLLARLHLVGERFKAKHRLTINPKNFGTENIESLIAGGVIPVEVREHYVTTAKSICDLAEPLFTGIKNLRIHGDCHRGNILQGRDGLFMVDFDDMLNGPAVQDMWLLASGRDDESRKDFDIFLEAYTSMRDFDIRELRLIEALRALRYIHFSSWISKRWADPSFPRAFPYFGTAKYWQDQVTDLREQWALLQELST